MSMDRNKMRGIPRRIRTAISKGTYCGRHVGAYEIFEEGGRQYSHVLHATKGWRVRRVVDPAVRRRLIGI